MGKLKNRFAENIISLHRFLIKSRADASKNNGEYYHEPFINKELAEYIKDSSNLNHKICFNCRYYLVGRMPNRMCFLHKKESMYSPATSSETEMEYTGKEYTVADRCIDYLERKIK